MSRKVRENTPGSALHGFLWHAGAFAISASTLNLSTPALAWWGLAVAMHGVTTLPRLPAWWRARQAAGAVMPGREPASEPTALPRSGVPAGESTPGDPFVAELERALAALGAASRGQPLPPGLDLEALRRAAVALRERHLALAELAAPAERDRLLAERKDALERADRSPDPRTAEVLQAQARSVGERLEGLDRAVAAAARLEARERTLLHQLEALRISLVQAGVDEERAPDLADEVRRLQLDVRATAELESDLARARLGAGAAQRT